MEFSLKCFWRNTPFHSKENYETLLGSEDFQMVGIKLFKCPINFGLTFSKEMFVTTKKEQILKLANEETPLFIYDLESVEKKANLLISETKNVIHKIFYAMKANANLQILQLLYKKGFGFECVSIGKEFSFLNFI
jgi:hypothetical protein